MSRAPEERLSGAAGRNESFTEKDMKKLMDDPRWAALIDGAAEYQDTRNDEGHAALVTLWADLLLQETGIKAG